MSIVLPSVLNMREHNETTNHIQNGHLRSMHEVEMYCMYLDGQFVDNNDILLADTAASKMKVF